MKRKKLLIILIAVAIAVLFIGLKFINGKKQQPDFKAVTVELGDIRVTILATGVVEPQNRVEIKPPIAGRAEDILVKEGDIVKKGQILAWMSSVERAALLDAARAKGAVEVAHWEDLYKPAPLVAPLNGVIISRNVEPGQTVTAQDAMLVMSNRLIVKAQVDETDIGKIKIGQEAEIILDAYPDEKIKAVVDHIAYEAKTVNNVTIYEADILPELVPDFMRSGMTSNVTFLVSVKKNILLLPAEAVRQEEGRSVVTMLDQANGKRTVPTTIETGLSDGKRIEITSGLKEGDIVLVRGFKMPSVSQTQNSPFMPGRRPQSSRTKTNTGSSK